MIKPNVIIINPKDNVAIAIETIPRGSKVLLPGGGDLIAQSEIPYSHKVALTEIAEGDSIIKYGELIGKATEKIGKGQWIHTHNLDIENKR